MRASVIAGRQPGEPLEGPRQVGLVGKPCSIGDIGNRRSLGQHGLGRPQPVLQMPGVRGQTFLLGKTAYQAEAIDPCDSLQIGQTDILIQTGSKKLLAQPNGTPFGAGRDLGRGHLGMRGQKTGQNRHQGLFLLQQGRLSKPEAVIEKLSKANPLERLAEPDDIANVVAFLASPDGGWVNGQVLCANGGMI